MLEARIAASTASVSDTADHTAGPAIHHPPSPTQSAKTNIEKVRFVYSQQDVCNSIYLDRQHLRRISRSKECIITRSRIDRASRETIALDVDKEWRRESRSESIGTMDSVPDDAPQHLERQYRYSHHIPLPLAGHQRPLHDVGNSSIWPAISPGCRKTVDPTPLHTNQPLHTLPTHYDR